MSNVGTWSVVAGDNNDPPPNGAPENMLRSAVNNTMREMMAALARWYQDNRAGSLVTTNATNAYSLTTNSAHTSLGTIGLLTFRVNASNTGAVTLNVDNTGATPWQRHSGVAYSAGQLIANQLVTVAYNATNMAFETVGGTLGEFQSGDSIIEMQDTATLGWVKDTTAALHNVALRLVSTTDPSGGNKTNGVSFTSALKSWIILEANLPNVTKAVTITDTRTYSLRGGNAQARKGNESNDCMSSAATQTLNMAVTASGTISGVTAALGDGTAMNFAVNYRDVIKVNKS